MELFLLLLEWREREELCKATIRSVLTQMGASTMAVNGTSLLPRNCIQENGGVSSLCCGRRWPR